MCSFEATMAFYSSRALCKELSKEINKVIDEVANISKLDQHDATEFVLEFLISHYANRFKSAKELHDFYACALKAYT